MNKLRGGILLYLIIVGISIYIIFRWFRLMENEDEKTFFNYVIIILFIVFTLINIRKLGRMIREYRKK